MSVLFGYYPSLLPCKSQNSLSSYPARGKGPLSLSSCRLKVVYCSLHLHLDLDLNVKPNLELNLKLNLELNVKLCKQCRGGATPF